MHSISPACAANFPAAQATHSTAPSPLAYVPLTHSLQVLDPLAPVYVPGPHAVQLVAPFAVLYFPRAHDAHPTFNEVALSCTSRSPSAQLRQLVEPAVEYVELEHEEQELLADALLYLPSVHSAQEVKGLTLVRPASQSWHDVAPTAELYVPATQSEQVDDVASYFPATHSAHSVAPSSLTAPSAQSPHSLLPDALENLPSVQRLQ